MAEFAQDLLKLEKDVDRFHVQLMDLGTIGIFGEYAQ